MCHPRKKCDLGQGKSVQQIPFLNDLTASGWLPTTFPASEAIGSSEKNLSDALVILNSLSAVFEKQKLIILV